MGWIAPALIGIALLAELATSPRCFAEQFAYVANGQGNTLSRYRVDSDTGVLSSLGETRLPDDQDFGPQFLAVDTSQTYLYVAHSRGPIAPAPVLVSRFRIAGDGALMFL